MNYEQFKRLKMLTVFFILATVGVAFAYNNMVLALAGVLIGMLFIVLVRRRVRAVLVDERLENISGRAARWTYAILTVFIALLSLLLIMIGRRAVPQQEGIETLGIVFSYVALLNLALYSFSYKYFAKKYGDTDDEQD